VSDAGIAYTNADAPARKKLKLTPEKCIQIQDGLAQRLATIHNLRFYTMLMEGLRGQPVVSDQRRR